MANQDQHDATKTRDIVAGLTTPAWRPSRRSCWPETGCPMGTSPPPLRFNAIEMAAIRRAAAHQWLAPGAWASARLVQLAQQELVVIPISERDRLMELALARGHLADVGIELRALSQTAQSPQTSATAQDQMTELLRRVAGAVSRVQRAADVVADAELERRRALRRLA